MAINLAPETQFALVARRRRNLLFALSALVMVVMLAAWGILALVQLTANQNLKTVQQELSRVENEISQREAIVQRIIAFEQRLAALDQLLTNHTSVNKLFTEVERLLPPASVLVSLATETNEGVVRISGRTPVLDDLAQALASLENQPGHGTLFNRVRFNEATQSEDTAVAVPYNFSAALYYDPNFLRIRPR